MSKKEDAEAPLNRALLEKYYRPQDACLSQGDIIDVQRLAAALSAIPDKEFDPVSEVYPYFFKNYPFAIVLNADCDLYLSATEKREPKVGCVQLAAVLEASEHMRRLLSKVKDIHFKLGIIDERTYTGFVRDKFESLINNQEKLYFYLPENHGIGFKSAHLARLDTSISFRIRTNNGFSDGIYDAFVKSRVGSSLEEPFKSKLGENFSALYDRTGLVDFSQILSDKYEEWLEGEIKKYFKPVRTDIFRSARKDLEKMEPNSPDFDEILVSTLERHKQIVESKLPTSQFMHLENLLESSLGTEAAGEVVAAIKNHAELADHFFKPPPQPKKGGGAPKPTR